MKKPSSLNRFFVNPSAIQGEDVTFPLEVTWQIEKVLRLDLYADKVLVLDNTGKSYLVELAGKEGKALIGRIIESYLPENENHFELDLAFSLTKREKLEWILQKGTELGVTGFRPFVSERSLDRNLQIEESRLIRWQAIIKEAAEQSRRERLPVLEHPTTYAQLLQTLPIDTLKLVAWEEADVSQQLSDDFLAKISPRTIRSVVLLIGPEGGFSLQEVEMAESKGFHPFSLGKRTLRMETACLAACALVTNLVERRLSN